MEIKNYFNKLLELPRMVNEKLPMNRWNSIVENSENSIPNWINTLFKLLALGLMLGSFLGGVSYLADTQNGDPVFDMDKPVMVDKWVPREYVKSKRVEGTGEYVEVDISSPPDAFQLVHLYGDMTFILNQKSKLTSVIFFFQLNSAYSALYCGKRLLCAAQLFRIYIFFYSIDNFFL